MGTALDSPEFVISNHTRGPRRATGSVRTSAGRSPTSCSSAVTVPSRSASCSRPRRGTTRGHRSHRRACGPTERGGHAIAEVIHGTTVATNAVLERREAAPRSSRPAASAMCSSYGGSASPTCTTCSGANRRARRPRTPLRDRRAVARRRNRRRARSTSRGRGARGSRLTRPRSRRRRRMPRSTPTSIRSTSGNSARSFARAPRRQRSQCRGDPARAGRVRTLATTAVNAYVQPIMASYLDRIRTGAGHPGVSAPLMIMQSSGGISNTN